MSEIKKIATRDSYGEALAELGNIRKDMIVLDADLAAATKTGVFKKAHPDRHIDCGIAECNMMSIAAGLASTGKLVYASTFAMFAAGRAFEQVRNSIGYPNLPVKIGATHGGMSVGEDGASHQCNEDIALMRTIPGMTIINPADHIEAKKAVFAAADINGPVYMRFGRLAVPVIFDESYDFKVGKGIKMTDGKDVAIIANGIMTGITIEAAEQLKNEGISAMVINMATVKPLDTELVLHAAKTAKAIVVAEEHSIIGGLGGAIAEYLSETRPTPVLRIGAEDTFGMSGAAPELLKYYGMSSENIVCKCKQAIKMTVVNKV